MPTENLQLPVGRIVWGHPIKSQQKRDQQTRAVILKDGKPVDQWSFGLAIPAQDFVQRVWPAMEAEAKSGFPQGIPPTFSFKYKDGTNGVDRSGKPYNTREGYAGHYVLTIATEAFAPPVYKFENGSYRQLVENEIKCGDYVLATINLQVNVPQNKSHTPGIYINPRGVLLVGYGKEIVGAAADPTQIFGQQPPQFQLPPGASMTPIAPTNTAPPYAAPGGMPGQPGQPGGYAPQPGPGGYQQPGMPHGGPQPGGYVPQGSPQISTGPGPQSYPPQPGQPGGYQQPGMPQGGPGNPAYAPPGMPQGGPQPGQPGGYAPAHDFVHNAGQQQPGYAPQPGPGPQGQYYGGPR